MIPAYHGMPAGPGKFPVMLADSIKVPVLGLYAGIDAFMKQDTIAPLRQGRRRLRPKAGRRLVREAPGLIAGRTSPPPPPLPLP